MNLERLKILLDDQNDWPASYIFKFLIKKESKEQLLKIIGELETSEKLSKKGNYISITAKKVFNSSDEILDIYKRVAHIEGIISL